jgi:serine/threonine-protein kinase
MSDGDQELTTIARSRLGQTLRKYHIDELIGVGGMAAVYVATHRNGRQFALKVLHPLLSVHADIRKRFLLEGHAANSVKHPGVVAILDDDIAEDGTTFLVMELLTGQSVDALLRRYGGQLTSKIALAVAGDVCDVLAVAHDVGVVHRDLKPANLFLTAEGQAKVLDFGLARLRDTALGLKTTASGIAFGTPAFLPPEQAAGHPSQIDARTDVWAVGATLFTLLSGKTVHEGESAQQLVVRSATQPARSLATVLPDIDPAIVALVDRALSFNKEDRWSNGAEMRDAIRNVSRHLFGETTATLVGLTRASNRKLALLPTMPAPVVGVAPEMVGARTTEPISSSTKGRSAVDNPAAAATAVIPRAGRSRQAVALLAAAAVGVLVVGLRLRSDHRSGVIPLTEPSSTAPPREAQDVGALAPSGIVATAPTPIMTAGAVLPPASSPAASASSTATVGKRPHSAQPRPAVTKATPDCTDPYTDLPSGKHVWKRECL